MPRGAPNPRKGSGSKPKPKLKKRRWTPSEESRLRVHFASLGEDWAAIVAALEKDNFEVRSEQSVLGKLAALGLHEQESRRQSGGNWHAQGRRQGDKNKKRKAASKGSPAATSPDAPPPRRASVQASSQIQEGEAEGAELDRELAGELGKVVGITKEANRHLAWAFYFVETLGAPAEEHWDGRGGTVSQIADTFHVKMGSRGSIRSVLVDVTECLGGRNRVHRQPEGPVPGAGADQHQERGGEHHRRLHGGQDGHPTDSG